MYFSCIIYFLCLKVQLDGRMPVFICVFYYPMGNDLAGWRPLNGLYYCKCRGCLRRFVIKLNFSECLFKLLANTIHDRTLCFKIALFVLL